MLKLYSLLLHYLLLDSYRDSLAGDSVLGCWITCLKHLRMGAVKPATVATDDFESSCYLILAKDNEENWLSVLCNMLIFQIFTTCSCGLCGLSWTSFTYSDIWNIQPCNAEADPITSHICRTSHCCHGRVLHNVSGNLLSATPNSS